MMSEARVKTEIAVAALIRRCAVDAVPAMVVRRGDGGAGALAIRINRLNGTGSILIQARDGEGQLGWLNATGSDPVADAECEAYLAKAIARDPDIWIVEIEDRKGRSFVTEPLFR